MTAPYASRPEDSRGRLYDEDESTFRSCFQRDRDRIIHASAFRRLKHKTQVFIEHEGDYFRTRLTHSIEVAQVARTIAGALGLNAELTEAVALAHDLGHTPFGHTGEDALSEAMTPYGGFDHNAQALRIVTALERHYARFDGLNLTWETLEGIAKHNGPVTGRSCPGRWPNTRSFTTWNSTHMPRPRRRSRRFPTMWPITTMTCMTGFGPSCSRPTNWQRSRSSTAASREVDEIYPDLNYYRRRHEALRRFFGILVDDVIGVARDSLAEIEPRTAQDIRLAGFQIIRFSPAIFDDLKVIRAFLFERMYRAPTVVVMRQQVTRVVRELFPFFMANPENLPKQWRKDVEEAEGETALARIVSDYIAGMTDRFAIQCHDGFIGGTDAAAMRSVPVG